METNNFNENFEMEKIEKKYQLTKTRFYKTLVQDLTAQVESKLFNPDHIVELLFRGFKFQVERVQEILYKELGSYSEYLIFSCDQTDHQDIYELKIKGSTELFFAMKEALTQVPEVKMYALVWTDFYFPMYCCSDVGYGYITFLGYESDSDEDSSMPPFWDEFDYVVKKDNVFYAVRENK